MVWINGVSGNPSGTRKDKIWADSIRKEALKPLSNGEPNWRKINKAAEKLLDMAMEGNINALQELGNRLDGKASQEITQTNINENGMGLLDAVELAGLILRIGRARGFAVPATLERVAEEEAGALPALSEAEVVSCEGKDLPGEIV